jgi:hypothetical protein
LRDLGGRADGDGLVTEQPHEGDGNRGARRDGDLLIGVVGGDRRPGDCGTEIIIGEVGVEDLFDVLVASLPAEEVVAAGERGRVDRRGQPRLRDVTARRVDADADCPDERHGGQRDEHSHGAACVMGELSAFRLECAPQPATILEEVRSLGCASAHH